MGFTKCLHSQNTLLHYDGYKAVPTLGIGTYLLDEVTSEHRWSCIAVSALVQIRSREPLTKRLVNIQHGLSLISIAALTTRQLGQVQAPGVHSDATDYTHEMSTRMFTRRTLNHVLVQRNCDPHILSVQWSHRAALRIPCCWKLCTGAVGAFGFSTTTGGETALGRSLGIGGAGSSFSEASLDEPEEPSFPPTPLNHANLRRAAAGFNSVSDLVPLPYLVSSCVSGRVFDVPELVTECNVEVLGGLDNPGAPEVLDFFSGGRGFIIDCSVSC
jgi:hypothetical protein